MKFCDPEAFDYPLVKKDLEEAGVPLLSVEHDQLVESTEQPRTRIQGFLRSICPDTGQERSKFRMYLGLDIGSSSLRWSFWGRQGEILAAQVVNLGTGTKGVHQALEAAYAQAGAGPEGVRYAVVTGYGRMTYQGADKQITEISCHAKGVRHLSPEARTIVDVGGQDTKVIRLNDQGGVENFVMNDKCAAGTGRFLEVMARVLDCPIQSLAQLARAGGGAGVHQQPVHRVCRV